MSDRPVFCSFYTNPVYGEMALRKLLPSLWRHGLVGRVDPRPDLGSWAANVRQKPRYLIEVLRAAGGRPVVWIDADAEILEYPEMLMVLPSWATLAAHVWPHSSSGIPEIWSSVLFARPEAIPTLEAWEAANGTPETAGKALFTDPNLWRVLQDPPRLNALYRLPAEYAWIEYMMRGALPNAKPVIRHERVSRPMWMA